MRVTVANFLARDDGAVATDYVLLAATIVGMSVSSVNSVRNGVGNLAGDVSTALTSARVTLLCMEGSGSLGGLCDAGVRAGGADPVDPGTQGPIVTIGVLGGEPQADVNYEDLFALDEKTAAQYLEGLAALGLDEIEKHVVEIEEAFREARSIGDTYRTYAAIDQLMLVHYDVSTRPETNLYASQLQALYYDWVAAIR